MGCVTRSVTGCIPTQSVGTITRSPITWQPTTFTAHKKPGAEGRVCVTGMLSGLVDAFLDRVLGVALELLGFALYLLSITFALKARIIGSLTDTLFDFTDGFVGIAFDLVCCAAHVTPHFQWLTENGAQPASIVSYFFQLLARSAWKK